MSKLTKALTAAAGNAGESLYVEDVFSTYLYEGNSSTQTITNDIDLDGEGGLVWIKARDIGYSNYFFDTERGAGNYLRSNSDSNSSYDADMLTAFNSNGFSLSSDIKSNNTLYKYASWTFRKAEKFFDVVTYTGATGPVAHNLGSVPKVILIKAVSGTYSTNDWMVYHADVGAPFLNLNDTDAALGNFWTTSITDTHFTPPGNTSTNGNGTTYVAYLFASDAGGFGDNGSESIIKCGSYTGTGAAGHLIDTGFEPQWVLIKRADGSKPWYLVDNMRNMGNKGSTNLTSNYLFPHESWSEDYIRTNYASTHHIEAKPTGFAINPSENDLNLNGGTFIYIAIRRPMKTPESGTEVFAAVDDEGSKDHNLGFSPDLTFFKRTDSVGSWLWYDRLRGNSLYLRSNGSNAEATLTNIIDEWTQEGVSVGSNISSGDNYFLGNFKRATGFFDVVAYTGNTTTQAVTHNLGVTPELIIVKARLSVIVWPVWSKSFEQYQFIKLNDSEAKKGDVGDYGYWTATAPTSTQFSVGTYDTANKANQGMIAYLFATLAGVSKVGSYTGTGADLNVDCGFSAGARFILIKRTDSTGDWYVWDSVRGIVAGNDPYLLLNSTAAEVTSTDYIDPLSSGFTVTSSAPSALNASGGNYIFLAIA